MPPYGTDPTTKQTAQAAASIRIMAEGEQHSEQFDQVAEIFGRSTVIYFLGFAYHKTNLQRLLAADGGSGAFRETITVGRSTTRRRVKGTALQMGDVEMRPATRAQIECHNADCLSFLRKVGDLD